MCSIFEENRQFLSFSHLVPQTNQHYFLHRSLSNSFSSSSSSLLLLSYCEHRQTTYYSSSGFAILRSSLRFLFPDINNTTQRILAVDPHHASLSSLAQTLSTPILTLMSTNENNLLTNNDYNNNTTITTTTTTNSFLPSSNTKITTTTTAVSNISVFHPSQQGNHRTVNLTLLIGCISGGIIIIVILLYALVKYRNRDEGSYKIDESKNFVSTSHPEQQQHEGCGGILSSSTHHRQKLLTTNGQNPIDSREWYV